MRWSLGGAAVAVLVCPLYGCGKPPPVSLVRIYVLEDRSIKIEGSRYLGLTDARAAVKQIELKRPDVRFVLSVANMAEPDAIRLGEQLSDGDGKVALVGILTEPKRMPNH